MSPKVTPDHLYYERPTSLFQTGVIARGATHGEALRVGRPENPLTPDEVTAIAAQVELELIASLNVELISGGQEPSPSATAHAIAGRLVREAEQAKQTPKAESGEETSPFPRLAKIA